MWTDRFDAGYKLAESIKPKIDQLQGKGVVLGLPRGGLQVAKSVAESLNLPLDFRAVRKIGHPLQPEFAIGAVDISGVSVKNPFIAAGETVPDEEFEKLAKAAIDTAWDIEFELSGDTPSQLPGSDWCLVVDDGAATGLTILAAIKGLKQDNYDVYIAVPVTSMQAMRLLQGEADGFYCLESPDNFFAVGQYYGNFSQVSTDEAKALLGR
ncbi:MAG TPA: phosphoribosyltransferase family protein [bacterium]|jgi:predicted phosphoribosyltransferase